MPTTFSEPDLGFVRVGNEYMLRPLQVGDKIFHFSHVQRSFLYQLKETGGDIAGAAIRVSKDADWAMRFLASPKFKALKRYVQASTAARKGELLDWWWDMAVDGANEKRAWYEASCGTCQKISRYKVAEAETMRNDNMEFDATCAFCDAPVALEYKEAPYHPTREAVQFHQIIGDRIEPKIERVHHEFSAEHFKFEFGDAA